MMRTWREMIGLLAILGVATLMAACGSDDDGSAPSTAGPSETQTLTGDDLAQDMVALWLDVDFSFQNPDGTSDTDSDGQTDTNDAVNFVETLKDLGYDVPPTTVQGLYDNYYTAAGYAQTDDAGLNEADKIPYTYTADNAVSQADLQAQDWSGLAVGDLIFIDYDKDFIWDNAAVYLGAYGDMGHAVASASDYYDKVVIEDLDDSTSILVLDIVYGYCDVRTPAYDEIANI